MQNPNPKANIIISLFFPKLVLKLYNSLYDVMFLVKFLLPALLIINLEYHKPIYVTAS